VGELLHGVGAATAQAYEAGLEFDNGGAAAASVLTPD